VLKENQTASFWSLLFAMLGLQSRLVSFMGMEDMAKKDKPRFSAPQQSQERTFFSLPLDAGSKLPQSVQKIKEPIAAIVCAV